MLSGVTLYSELAASICVEQPLRQCSVAQPAAESPEMRQRVQLETSSHVTSPAGRQIWHAPIYYHGYAKESAHWCS
jgi:hypothetical protein